MALFYSFTNPFNVWFNRRQLYSHTASAFNLMSYVILVEVYEENPASHKHAVGKGRDNLIAFPNNFGYSSLMLHCNSISGSFLKSYLLCRI